MANLESRGWMLRPTILLAIPFLTLIALVHAHPNPNPFPHLEATEESQRNESMSRLKFEGLNRLLRRDEAKPGDENRGLKNGKWDYEHFEKETPPKLFYVEIDDWNTLQASAMTYFYPREYIKNEPTKGDYVWWENENEVTNHDDAFWGIFIWCQASKVSPYYDGILDAVRKNQDKEKKVVQDFNAKIGSVGGKEKEKEVDTETGVQKDGCTNIGRHEGKDQDGQALISMMSICGPEGSWIHSKHLEVWVGGARRKCIKAQREGFKIMVIAGKNTKQHHVTLLVWTADPDWKPAQGEDINYPPAIGWKDKEKPKMV